jgi:cellulose synthase/poly-beta-1,6-N-acetylglucosamine synthase-like glycosyltransferase
MYELILNIYLIALLVVGLFSLESLYLSYKYWQRGKKIYSNISPDYEPLVTVQLPIYNELYVAERLIQSVCEMDYPRDRLQIQVLDDSSDHTSQICQEQVTKFRNKGFDIELIQ